MKNNGSRALFYGYVSPYHTTAHDGTGEGDTNSALRLNPIWPDDSIELFHADALGVAARFGITAIRVLKTTNIQTGAARIGAQKIEDIDGSL